MSLRRSAAFLAACSALALAAPAGAGAQTGVFDAAPAPPAPSPSAAESAPPVAAAAARRTPIGCRRAGPSLRSNGSRNKRVVALTFDDGPSAYTADVIRVLVREQAKGTFFVLGDQIPGREGVLRRILGWGFEIGDHSFNHAQYAGGGERATRQLRLTDRRIKRATGFAPCVFRPPYGAVNGDLLRRARALGMTTVTWDVDPRDWARPGADTIYRRIVGAARPGSIILMHDGGGPRGQTVAALSRVITTLRARGYRFTTVSGLLGQRFVYPD